MLLQALTRWYFAAALCAAAEHRAACEVRLQGLQQAVAAFAQKLQGLYVLRQGGRGAAPAARSMVDKMTAIIAVGGEPPRVLAERQFSPDALQIRGPHGHDAGARHSLPALAAAR